MTRKPKYDIKVVILALDGDIEHVKRLKLPYPITHYINENDLKEDTTIVLRWGVGWEPRAEREFKNHITHYKDIILNCDKFNASKKLAEVVNTPRIYEKEVKNKKLIVLRPHHHAQGDGFRVERGPFKIPYGQYGKDFIRSEKESRLWICNGRSMMCRRVTQSEKRLAQKFKCRSKWGYSHWKKTPKYLHKLALKAAKHMGFQYGAFDIIWNPYTKKWVFLEWNSAIALDDEKVIKFFSRGMKSIINRKIKEVTKNLKKYPPLEYKFKVVNYDLMENKTIEEKPGSPIKPNGLFDTIINNTKSLFNFNNIYAQ